MSVAGVPVFVCLSVWVGAPAAPKVTLLDGSTNLEAHNLSPKQGDSEAYLAVDSKKKFYF